MLHAPVSYVGHISVASPVYASIADGDGGRGTRRVWLARLHWTKLGVEDPNVKECSLPVLGPEIGRYNSDNVSCIGDKFVMR